MKWLCSHATLQSSSVSGRGKLGSDQCQNSPAASQEIWHHTVWRTWLFIAYSDEKWLYYKFSLHHSYNRFLKGWENTLFELRSESARVALYCSYWPIVPCNPIHRREGRNEVTRTSCLCCLPVRESPTRGLTLSALPQRQPHPALTRSSSLQRFIMTRTRARSTTGWDDVQGSCPFYQTWELMEIPMDGLAGLRT